LISRLVARLSLKGCSLDDYCTGIKGCSIKEEPSAIDYGATIGCSFFILMIRRRCLVVMPSKMN